MNNSNKMESDKRTYSAQAEQTRSLRAGMRAAAANPDWDFLIKYEIKPRLFWDRLLWLLRHGPGRVLRKLGLSRSFYYSQVWDARLRHVPKNSDAATLLLWNDIEDKQEARTACRQARDFLADKPEWIPVLVTCHADFAFYSRLGWLIEYLPDFPNNEEDGRNYSAAKRSFLAWRYRDAVIAPLSVATFGSDVFWRLVMMKDQ